MMELNDTTDYQRCFVCGQRNPFGLKLVYRQEEDSVVADFLPKEEHQGYPGVLHGGIAAAVLDESMGRAPMIAGNYNWTMTGRLELRYRKNIPFGPILRTRAWLDRQRGRMIQAHGIITLAEDESVIFTEGQGSFIVMPPEAIEELTKGHPELESFFKNSRAKE